ncbi:MAG: WG repeat-containing protein [Clostridia bacterium]|nr:WG repeat-containing protein [Clostridia bacterium]
MKKNIIKISIFVLIVLLAILFMVLGAKEQGRKYKLEEVKEFNYFVLQKDGKYGVIDKTAKIVVEPKYENVVIPNPSKAIFVCTQDNKENKIYNEKNEQKFTEYDEVSSIRLKNITSNLMYEKSVLKYKKGDKYGIMDLEGSKITEPIYDKIDALEYKEGELVVSQNGKYGVINIKGINLVPINYETINADGYYDGKNYSKSGYKVGIRTKEGYRYGYINSDGDEILSTDFNEITRVNDIKDENSLYLLASKNGQYGIYKGKEQILNNEYQSINYNKDNNIFILERSKKFGIANIDGKIIIDVKYVQIDITGKYIYVKDQDGKTEVLNSQGKIVNMSKDISKLSTADGKYTIVIKDEDNKTLYGIEDASEHELVKPQYSYIENLFDEYFIASNSDGNVGVIDSKGNVKVELKYNSIQEIKDTKLIQAKLKDEQSTHIYSSKMEKIAEMKNAIITETEGYIKANNEEEVIYISKEGKKVDNKTVYKNNKMFAIEKNGKWGYEDQNGNIKVECKYDKVTEFNEFGFAGIKSNGKWGVINSDMKVIAEPQYEFAAASEPSFLGTFYKVTYAWGEVIYTNN